MAVTTAAPPAASTGTREVLALADRVELLGEYEDSGFHEPPLLARRGDGQMIKLTPLLYRVAAGCDGRRDAEQVAAVVSEHLGRGVSADNVRQLAEQQLRPLGVLTQPDGTTPELPKRQALLALRHRRPILPAGAVNVIAAAFAWLHARPVKWLLLAALVAFDAWLFGFHGIAGGIRAVLYDPSWLLAVLVSVVVATAFHEIGHASACRSSGARPGEMGVGVYLIWPAFYCDVTEAYRLDRPGRLRTDLGGVYFNGVFALACGAAYLPTGQEALLFAAFVQHLIVLQQLLPLLRFDGYYVLSDLTGVPDILSRVKPIFRSLVPGRKEPRVAELKPWVRAVVTSYLLVLVPALLLVIAVLVLSAPRTFATAYDSFWLQLDRMRASEGFAEHGVGAFRIAALVLPLAAITLSVSRSARLGVRGIATWSRGSVLRRAVAVAGVGTAVAATAFVWWPNGDYEPIRPGERGTIGEVVRAVPQAPSGRPAFTPERAAEFAPAPTVRERAAAAHQGAGPAVGPETPAGDEAAPGEDLDGGNSGGAGADEDPAAGTDPDTDETPTGSDPTATPSPVGTAPAGTAPTAQPSPSGTTAPTATATPTPSAGPTPTPAATSTPSATSDAYVAPDATALGEPSPLPDTGTTQALESEPTPPPTP